MPADIAHDWGMNLQAVVCNRCDWNFLLPEGSSRQCPHCFEGNLENFDASSDNLPSIAPPELMMSYQVDKTEMAIAVGRFAQGIPFPPQDLTVEEVSARAQRVFLPMWLVDAHIEASWEAQLGYPYQVESHKSSYSGGQWYSQKVLETRLDWEKRLGRLQRDYQNITAPALDKHQALMKALGGYPSQGVEAYSSSKLEAAYVRLPQRSTKDAFSDAQENFKQRAGEEVLQATEANQIRDFRWQADYSAENWTLMLLPSYLSYYTDDSGTKRLIYLNGQNAQISGAKRGSMARARQLTLIGLAVTAVLMLTAIAVVVLYPKYETAGIIGAIIAAIVGFGSLLPVIQVWQFNEQQERLSSTNSLY